MKKKLRLISVERQINKEILPVAIIVYSVPIKMFLLALGDDDKS